MTKKIWKSQFNGICNPELEGTPVPLGDLLEQSAASYGSSIAIKQESFSINYIQFAGICKKVAANLKRFGLQKQDKVGILLPNSKESIIGFWGAVTGGFVCVMTNPLYSPSELQHQYADAEIKALITYDALLPKVLPIIDKTAIEHVFVGTEKPEEFKPADKRFHLIQELMGGDEYYKCPDIDIENDLAMLQYTGGTTGISKGCMLTHKNIWSNAKQVYQMFEKTFKPGVEKFVGVLPFFHIYGLQVAVIVPIMLSACILPVLRFTPRALLALIQNEKATCVPSAPAIFNACILQKEINTYDLSSLKLMISGSAPLPIAQMQEFEKKTGCQISEGYGLSEASPVTHFTSLGKHVVGSIGFPLPGTDAKIVDLETGTRELGVGEEGELCIQGPQVMKGYYKQKDQTDLVLRDGWLYTGDICKYDENGFFYITDRKKDLIICGGYNVYPREIEEALMTNPKVKEAVAIGVKDRTRGEIVKAFVVLREGEVQERPTELIEHCRKMLANYKVPREIEIRESLPKSSVGKVLKRMLRDEENMKRAGHLK